ncbi:zinc finger protein 282-like isoform X3 [Pelobates fuscus]|uniref:zinc finger protein 282-like isoform X3 n=1 Tax=Pelobates fuscus TaxID=191477 RepID=UPI002FE4D337
MAFQVPVVFNNVVASFTVEQWINLAGWKKELYHNVVKDIHKILKKQGYTIINPDVLFNIQKTDESCIRIDSSLAEREPDVVRDVPDLLLRLKEESAEEAHCSTEKPKIKEERDTALPPKSCPVITSVVSLSIKEEQMARDEVVKVSVPSKANPPEVQDGSMFFIKQEEEVYSIDDYNTVGLETTVQETSSPTVTIKQEFDPLHQIKQEETRGYPDIIPVVVKEEEGEPMEEISTTVSSAAVVPTKKKTSRREAEEARLLAMYFEERHKRPVPEYFLDVLAWDPIKTADDCVPAPPAVRVGHVRWCTCGLCISLPTDEECICCRDIVNVRKLLLEDSECICEIEYLRKDLVSREHLTALYRYGLSFSKKRFKAIERESDYRITAYRAFTMWVHGYMGRNVKRRPIPSCVVRRIRDNFPAPDKTYVGVCSVSDDPYAAYMCDL